MAKRTLHICIFIDWKQKFWTAKWEFDNKANGNIWYFFLSLFTPKEFAHVLQRENEGREKSRNTCLLY